MKKILILVPNLGIGGQEKIAINTAKCLKSSYDVKIVIFEKRPIEYEYPCEVINLEAPATQSFFKKVLNQVKRIFKLSKLRRRWGADVVISLGNTANLTNVLSGLVSAGKSISSIHGFAEVKKSFIMRTVLRLSHKVICIAQAMQSSLLSIYPNTKNTVVIENGYDIDGIIEKADEPIEELLPHPMVFSMGRLEKVKGFDRLIKAFARVKQTKADLHLVLLGKGSLYDELCSLASSEGVGDSVHLLGYRANPYAYLKQADIYVLSSRNEGFPNALIESLALELPIVSIDCMSGPREILSEQYTDSRVVGVVEEKYGILVEEAQTEEEIIHGLSSAILTMTNGESAMRYRALGRKRACQFTDAVYKEKIIALIEEAIS